jgi:hypothetical protein
MIRKDSAPDADRAHNYSQFWIEVAAGRPISHGAQAVEEAEPEEDDLEALLSAPPMAPFAPVTVPRADVPRADVPRADVPRADVPRADVPRAEPKPKPRAADKKDSGRSLSSLADLANIADLMSQSAQMEDDTVPDIEAGVASSRRPEAQPDFDFGDLTAEDEEEESESLADEAEDFGDFEDEEEEEEEDEWGGSRRPKPKKPPRRDRRGF